MLRSRTRMCQGAEQTRRSSKASHSHRKGKVVSERPRELAPALLRYPTSPIPFSTRVPLTAQRPNSTVELLVKCPTRKLGEGLAKLRTGRYVSIRDRLVRSSHLRFWTLAYRVHPGFLFLGGTLYVTQTGYTSGYVRSSRSDGSEDGSSGAQRHDVNSVDRWSATPAVTVEDWWSTTAAITMEDRWSTTATVALEVT